MVIENHIFLWLIVGAASGIVLGLSGTGGGIISIPILMSLGGYDIKQASGYALLVLTVGATITWFLQRKNTIYPLVTVLVFFAGTVAFIAAPLKSISPQWLITVLLNLTCIFSLYSLWILRKPEDPGEWRPFHYQLKTASIGGVMTGFLSTMTGLGGGVVIIPWLTGVTRLRFDQALACSLLTIAITAPISAWRQHTIDLSWIDFFALASAVFVASFFLKKMIAHMTPPHLILIRKLVLSGVILISMMRTLVSLF